MGYFNFCEYNKHEVVGNIYSYLDKDNGIEYPVRICKDCYLKHLFKHYPKSASTLYYYKFEHETWMDEFISEEDKHKLLVMIK